MISMAVPITTQAVPSSVSRLALETYYDILEYVDCKHELAKLARTAFALQRPAESRLYHTVALHGEQDLRVFRSLLETATTSRIGRFVKKISYQGVGCAGGTQENNRGDRETVLIMDVLGNLQALNELCIEGANGWHTSSVLRSSSSGSLTVLRCSSLKFDLPCLDFLRGQTHIRELHIQCTLPDHFLPSELDRILDARGVDVPRDGPQLHSTHRRLLPNLRALRTNSHALALALIPGRSLSRVWITESDDFISTPTAHPLPTSTTQRATTAAEPWGTQVPQQQGISPASDTTSRETRWCDLFHEFATALSYQTACGELRTSVRLNFGDVPQAVIGDVLRDFAKFLGPTMRTLGFLNSAAVEELLNWPDTGDVEMFTHLHTMVLDYTPSVAVVERLSRAPALPALRTVACYGFSRSFEYLCIPVNDARGFNISRNPPQSEASGWCYRTGDIEWVTDLEERRRATPLHDPNYRLWLDA